MIGIDRPLILVGIGWQELILIFLVVLLIFGARRIPDIAQGIGKGIREFKKALRDTEDEIKNNTKDSGPDKPDKTH
ncbi:MAG: twin-arginine translocase TatA/TatE family subunit [Candidatus Zixiibacteriota bacterium]|jgi:sec-independent protein translocase protein TatA